MDRHVRAARDRAPLADHLGGRAHLGGAEPRRAWLRRFEAEVLRARDAPVSLGRAARRPPQELHDRRRRSPTIGVATATRSSTRWATTRSACRRRTTRSRPACHPREATEASIASYNEQFRAWGISIDWSREASSHEPSYYRWTQWIFLRLYERGLAYRQEAAVNWCPKDATVLANEQVIDGRCERCGTVVERRELEQWFFKITDYADRLLEGLDEIDWPAERQDDAAQLDRPLGGRPGRVRLRGARHRLRGLHDPARHALRRHLLRDRARAPRRAQAQRLARGSRVRRARDHARPTTTSSARTRIARRPASPLGRTVTNPVNGEQIPMYVSDYVVMGYGTGALMAVPAHDDRDHEFATKFGIEIREVVSGGEDVQAEPYIGDGPLVNSGRFDGKNNREAYDEIVDWLHAEGKGEIAVNYRLRDWLLSRQRYWGCPIPMIYCETDGLVPVPDDQLPVELPDVEDYAPKGQSPLAAVADWVNVECPVVRRPGPARDRHDGHLRRLLLVLPALPRPAQRRGSVRPRAGRLLDAGRQLHRRDRARDPAPHVRALLHEGVRGHGHALGAGAVRQPLHPGHDHDGRGEDVLLEGQHGQRHRDRRQVRRRHRPRLRLLPRPARPRRRLGPRGCRGRSPLPRPPLPPLRRGGRADRASAANPPPPRDAEEPAGHDLLVKTHWAIDKVSRDITGLSVPHRDLGRDGARQRGLQGQGLALRRPRRRRDGPLRHRDGGVADLPLRAAHRRPGLRRAHRRARLGDAVASGRRVAARQPTRSRSSSRSTASAATSWSSRPTRRRRRCLRSPASRRRSSAISTARRS